MIANAWEAGSASTNIEGVECTFQAAIARMAGPGRLLVVSRGGAEAANEGLVKRLGAELRDREIACDCVVVGEGETEEAIGQRVVALCGGARAASS